MITADNFPTPDLALRSTDPDELDRVRQFARWQAAEAERHRVHLTRIIGHQPASRVVTALRDVHTDIVGWRYKLARCAPHRLGVGIPLNAERFQTPMSEGGPNYDRLGHTGRLRADATFDPTTQTFQGGAPTPASMILEAYGQAARERINAEGDGAELTNMVTVVDGHELRVPGNRLVYGEPARQIAAELVARVAARGRDTSQMEIGGDPVYAITANPRFADYLFETALALLASAPDLRPARKLRAWQDARYLLYQSPRTKKGSDAVTRCFLVAVGATLFGTAPTMEQDADLRCMVLGQQRATVMPADEALTS